MAGMALELARGLDLVAGAVRERRCILFLGAGVHAPPPAESTFAYPAQLRPPGGMALSLLLAEQCGFAERFPREDPTDLRRVALAYEIESSRARLVETIAGAVQAGRQPSPMVEALARMDFPLVITTNFDGLFERALRAAGKEPRVSVYSPEPEPTTEFEDESIDRPVIYKLHGDVAHPESIVVTDEDYIQFVLRMTDKEPYDPIPLSLKHYLKRWTTLFIGYSLLDYNLRLLFKTLRWRIDPARIPETYSVDHSPDPLILDVWQSQRRYVKFIATDVWSFVPALDKRVRGEQLAPDRS
jgi:hypothetical protein